MRNNCFPKQKKISRKSGAAFQSSSASGLNGNSCPPAPILFFCTQPVAESHAPCCCRPPLSTWESVGKSKWCPSTCIRMVSASWTFWKGLDGPQGSLE